MTQEQLQEQLDKATAKLEENIAEYAEILNKITDGEREKFSGNEFLSRKANFLAKITQTPEMRETQYYNDNFNDFCRAISPVKFLDFKSALNSAKSYKLVNDAEWNDTAGEQLADIMNEETEKYKNDYDVYDYDDVNAIVLRKALIKDFLCLDENQTLEDFAKNVLKSTRKNKRS